MSGFVYKFGQQLIPRMAMSDVKALAFDVFGTVVDYRSTIIREGERLNRAKGLEVDWAAFADAWRARYRPSMHRVMQGAQPWTTLDALHRQLLDELLRERASDRRAFHDTCAADAHDLMNFDKQDR